MLFGSSSIPTQTLTSSLFIGLSALRSNPLRTFLSTLGVVIGVSSLVAILSVTEGLEQFSRAQIEKTTDLHLIQVTPITSDVIDGVRVRREKVIEPDLADVESLRRALGKLARVTLACSGSGWLGVANDSLRFPAVVTATLPGTVDVFDFQVSSGRWLSSTKSDSDEMPIVLSRVAARRIARGDSSAVVVGQIVQVLGERFRVVGVITGSGEMTAARGIIPLNERTRALLGSPYERTLQLLTKVTSVENGEAVRKTLEEWLESRYGSVSENFVVSSSRQRIAQVAQAMFVFKLVMGSITGISLIVGGIGIMNILLASVSERTREIGIRRAAGASAGEIRAQFLTEAVTISAAGSLAGVIVGYLGSLAITAVVRQLTDAPFHAAFAWSSVVVAIAAAFLVGVTFGLYPARKASKLDPAEAIRYE